MGLIMPFLSVPLLFMDLTKRIHWVKANHLGKVAPGVTYIPITGFILSLE